MHPMLAPGTGDAVKKKITSLMELRSGKGEKEKWMK